MTVQHRPGKQHVNADALSRLQMCQDCTKDRHHAGELLKTNLPCRSCTYCTRAHQHWLGFQEAVDDVIPLASQSKQKTRTTVECETVIQPESALPPVTERSQSVTCHVNYGASDQKDYHKTPKYNLENSELDCKEIHDMNHNEKTIPDTKYPNIDTSALSHISIEMVKTPLGMSIHTPYMDSPNVNVTKESGLEAATYTPEVLRDFQSKDPDLEINLIWLRDNEEPSEATIFRCSQRAKKYWLNKEIFFIDESGLLRNLDKHSSKPRLVIPRDLTEEIMSLCHDIPSSGHQCINRTMKRIKDKYQWYGMAQRIRNFVETCSVCNSSKKANRKAKCPLTKYHSGAPMERVHLDFLGPLPETTQGNAHIFVMVDQFSKWLECTPLPTQTAEQTATAALNEFFSRFGFPFKIFTHQGRNFESRLFKSICDVLQIHKARTTPYRPSSNG